MTQAGSSIYEGMSRRVLAQGVVVKGRGGRNWPIKRPRWKPVIVPMWVVREHSRDSIVILANYLLFLDSYVSKRSGIVLVDQDERRKKKKR
jgi:hypothetical protein